MGDVPNLVLGPLLRYVDETSAAIWLETDRPCTATVLGTSCQTFTAHGHHYAIVDVTDLLPGTSTPYTVDLDGRQVWPEPETALPPSRISTPDPGKPARMFFGSCRVGAAYNAETTAKHGLDALRAYAHSLAGSREEFSPTILLLLGDQVYADEPPEEMRRFMRAGRDVTVPPGEELLDYAEYAELYRLAWTDPVIRWLLATVPTAMIFDDHDLRDDWNTSQAWRDAMTGTSWWNRRVVAGLGSYWVYQHLGNLSAAQRRVPLVDAMYEADGGAALDAFAERADHLPESTNWSFHRDFGRVRLVVLDSRCARVLSAGNRAMLAPAQWQWLREAVNGDYDHLVIASSVPALLPLGLQYGERWNEALCDGAWGRQAARWSEKLRQLFDLEHWGAFQRSFDDLARLLADTAGRARRPASITVISGDVHYSYLARVRQPRHSTPIHQVVCSPMRNRLSRIFRWANVVATWAPATWTARLLAAMARVPALPFTWRIDRGPWFDNAVASLTFTGRRGEVRWYRTKPGADPEPRLAVIAEHLLTEVDEGS